MLMRAASILGALALLTATPAQAEVAAFTAALSGHAAPTDTGSEATGKAKIFVDTDAKTVDITLDVEGLKMDQLWGALAHAKMGPIHLHRYGGHDHSDPGASALVFPLPMGANYVATPKGFHVEIKHASYAEAATMLNSNLPFADFMTSMQSGQIVLNVHTNAFHDGEISGEVDPVNPPA